MKTLAQLKRDLVVGTKLKCVYNKYTNKYLNKVRYIHTKDTTGIYLNESLKTVSKGSFLGFPKADRLVYEDDTFSIYTQNVCELTYQIL